jgi:hypothetical protein
MSCVHFVAKIAFASAGVVTPTDTPNHITRDTNYFEFKHPCLNNVSPTRLAMSSTSIVSTMEEDVPKTPIARRAGWVRLSLVGGRFLLSQWQIFGIVVAVVFAWLFPNVARRGGVIESQYLSA